MNKLHKVELGNLHTKLSFQYGVKHIHTYTRKDNNNFVIIITINWVLGTLFRNSFLNHIKTLIDNNFTKKIKYNIILKLK